MLLEAAQPLCTAARLNGLDDEWLYRSTHTSHPETKWVPKFRANWLQLRHHPNAPNQKFQERFDHSENQASWQVIQTVAPDSIELPGSDLTPRPLAVPEQYRVPGEPVRSYRTYEPGEQAGRATDNPTGTLPWIP